MAGSAPNVDLKALLTVSDSISANAADSENGTAVDLQGNESAMVIAGLQGVSGGGTIVFSVEEDDDDGSGSPSGSWSAIAAADLSGSFTAAAATDRTDTVGIVRSKRWVRVVATKASTVSAGEMYGVIVANASRHL